MKPLHKSRHESILDFEIFRNLSYLEAGIISRSVYRRTFSAGQIIVREGDAAAGIYLIESGSVKIYKEVKHKQVELTTLDTGSFFGELTMLNDRHRTATVVSTVRTELLCLFRPEFLEILHNYPAICTKILPAFSSVLVDRLERMYVEIEKLRNKLD